MKAAHEIARQIQYMIATCHFSNDVDAPSRLHNKLINHAHFSRPYLRSCSQLHCCVCLSVICLYHMYSG